MSQTILNEEAGETLRALAVDVEGALRYSESETISIEHVGRWSDALQTILGGRVVRPRPRAEMAD